MAVPSEPQVAPQGREFDATAFRRQGVVAGLFGAFLLAAWFLYLDTIRGHPLFTPTLLAESLLSLGHVESPETLRGSLPLTLLFTVVHATVFGFIGYGAAEFLIRFAHLRSRALIVLLIFGALCIAFFVFSYQVSAFGPHAVAVRDAFVGNAFAAFGMTAYLARNLPKVVPD
jgi:hypothetical protein